MSRVDANEVLAEMRLEDREDKKMRLEVCRSSSQLPFLFFLFLVSFYFISFVVLVRCISMLVAHETEHTPIRITEASESEVIPYLPYFYRKLFTSTSSARVW